jgi:hypothetical protein
MEGDWRQYGEKKEQDGEEEKEAGWREVGKQDGGGGGGRMFTTCPGTQPLGFRFPVNGQNVNLIKMMI